MPILFSSLLPTIPQEITVRIEENYNRIKRLFAEGNYENSELSGSKLCEAVLRLLQWRCSGNFTPFGEKIRDFGQASKSFESRSEFPDSIRFQIPKILNALYEIRNKRGVGHVRGDIDSNHMDAEFVVTASDWIMAEIVRIYHNITTEEATKIVESLVTKHIPLVWVLESKKRVLDPSLSYRDKMLVLLYGEYPDYLKEEALVDWVEHSNPSVFRRDVIVLAHKQKLLEYNKATKQIIISPTGRELAEKIIKKTFDS